MKRKIDKAAFDALSDAIKALYKEKDGMYVLDLEDGEDDAAELKRAKDREVQARKEAEKKLKELQDKLDEGSTLDAKKKGDIETLEKSWKEKLEKRESELLAKIKTKDAFIQKTLVDSVASSMSSKLAGDKAHLLSLHIKQRLVADVEGDVPTTKVLDANGNVSALTIADLEKEFVANKDFSAILVGNKANGSGAPVNNQQKVNSGANNLDANGKPRSFSSLSVQEKVDYIKQQKENNNNQG